MARQGQPQLADARWGGICSCLSRNIEALNARSQSRRTSTQLPSTSWCREGHETHPA
jgi:hypothetical protein